MAIPKYIGGIERDQHSFTTVISVERLLTVGIDGRAFEQEPGDVASFARAQGISTHRIDELRAYRGRAQRTFWKEATQTRTIKGKRVQVTKMVPTRKWENAIGKKSGGLREFIGGPYANGNRGADLPEFVLVFPEPLVGTPVQGVNAYMDGELFSYDITEAGRGVLLDSESRFAALVESLNDPDVPAIVKAAVRERCVTVTVYHGISAEEAATLFGNFNGKGIAMTTNEIASKDFTNPWINLAREVFEDNLGMTLETTGRQITTTSIANNRYLMLNQAVQMVRGFALGSVGSATSKSTEAGTADIEAAGGFDKVAAKATDWFRIVFDTVNGYDHVGELLVDEGRVFRSMPVKVAVAILGHPFYGNLQGNAAGYGTADLTGMAEARTTLTTINWTISEAWDGIAGKVTAITDDDDKPTGEYKVAAGSAKEIGNNAVKAIVAPNPANKTSKAYKAIRGIKG